MSPGDAMGFLGKSVLSLVILGLAAACARPLPVFGELPEFSLQDQSGQTVTKRDLTGSVWVADFIYTGCGTACPLLTQRLAEVGRELNRGGSGRPVRLVSFTVDPENDTPERLRAYGERFGATAAAWSFLTGPVEEIRRTVSEGFKLAYHQQDADVFHSEKLVVVDARGRIRGYFDASPDGLKSLRSAVERLKREGSES